MIVEIICVIVALYTVLRILLEKNTLKKLAFLNVFNFAVTGAIVILLPYPITIGVAAAYFIGATLESNAIASTIAIGGEE